MKPPKVVMFRTARGLVELSELRPEEARDLERRGKLFPDEVQSWARSRRRWLRGG